MVIESFLLSKEKKIPEFEIRKSVGIPCLSIYTHLLYLFLNKGFIFFKEKEKYIFVYKERRHNWWNSVDAENLTIPFPQITRLKSNTLKGLHTKKGWKKISKIEILVKAIQLFQPILHKIKIISKIINCDHRKPTNEKSH